MTILTYGGYTHDEYENTLNLNMRGLENQSGYVYGVVETIAITGILQADTLSQLLTKQAALQAAYQLQDQSLFWYSGSTLLYGVQAAQTLYGVRVVNPPSFTQGRSPGELVNRRSLRS